MQKPITQFLNVINRKANSNNNDMDTSTDESNSTDALATGAAATVEKANTLHSQAQHNLNTATPTIQLSKDNTWANTVLNGKSNGLGPKPSPIQLAALDKANYAAIIVFAASYPHG